MDTDDYVCLRRGALAGPGSLRDAAGCHPPGGRGRRTDGARELPAVVAGGSGPPSDLDAYVYRAVVNAFAKSRKRRWWGERPSQRLPESAAGGRAGARPGATMRHVLAALRRLSPEHREVLVLRFFADLSEQQVAARHWAIPAGTVKSRTSRALDRDRGRSDAVAALFNHEET